MSPAPDRLGFLRAIAAVPDDDTPRLVYADWLDEHAASDADRARAEFIRLSCGLKPKVRITKAEQEWLAANWRQLLPRVSIRLSKLGAKAEDVQWSGRHLKLWAHPKGGSPATWVSLELEFWRGFVRRVVYHQGFAVVGEALAIDEPLARHTLFPDLLPYPRPLANGRFRVGVAPVECFGPAVWDRIAGHTAVATTSRGEIKQFDRPDSGPLTRVELHRTALDAIAAAMTAQARKLAGWPEDLPTLG